MGYYTSLSGGLILSRPLNAREIKELEPRLPYGTGFHVLNTVEHTDEGELHKSETSEVVADDSVKTYGFDEDLNAFLSSLPEDVTAEGCIEGSGEDDDDVWRVHVKGRKMRRVQAELHWPEPIW